MSEPWHEYFWFHSIDLGNGQVTPGRKTVEILSKEYENTFNSVDLRGKSVLDVGAWNGAFTAEAAKRGAARITALDHVTWNRPGWHGREAFDFIVKSLSLPATAADIDLDARDLSLAHLGQFDVVLFLGVFYHLNDPLAAMREVAKAAKEVLIVESYVDRALDPLPVMQFYREGFHGDASNKWAPSVACIAELLRDLGFARVESAMGFDSYRQIFHAWR
jgi:tRNA (mo5U34)-methyltransferase